MTSVNTASRYGSSNIFQSKTSGSKPSVENTSKNNRTFRECHKDQDISETESQLTAGHSSKNSTSSAVTYASQEGNVKVGVGILEVESAKPDRYHTATSGQSGMTLGRLAISAIAIEGQMKKTLGPAGINAKVTIGTVNAHTSAEYRKSISNNSMEISASTGAEAIAFETTVGMNLTLSAKPVNDLWRTIYDRAFDPVIDLIARQDVPNIPSPFAALDGSLTVSGKISSGWGSALKLGAAASIQEEGYAMKANMKITPLVIGPTTGAEISVTVTR